MTLQFRDRAAAGEILAAKLASHARNPQGIVLALPRGGVPVAHAVARALGLPLDVFIVRKLGVPGHEELAMGAITSGGVCVTNDRLIASLQLPEKAFEAVRAREQVELERRERQYRPAGRDLSVAGKTAVLVDDGIATGASMRAAALALRKAGAGRIVVAVPVSAPSARRDLADVSDEFVAVLQPEDFQGVGQWYHDFTQVTDGEVAALLLDSASGGPGA
jgi:putative phosphoribosyl transferase